MSIARFFSIKTVKNKPFKENDSLWRWGNGMRKQENGKKKTCKLGVTARFYNDKVRKREVLLVIPRINEEDILMLYCIKPYNLNGFSGYCTGILNAILI